ncbi:MAG: histidine kinase, partial [Blastocatellia bacterium]|nr:histidine kinase [Blastocatellia bacterium]
YHQEQKFSDFEKATAIGRMAAQIAHEVNNPLEVIKNSLYLLQNSLNQQDHQTTKFLEVARKETERVSNIIKQMLVFPAKINTSDTKYVDVNRILEEIVVLVEKTLKQHQIDIKLHLFNNLPTVFISEDKLKQVILNLVLNSKEAMQAGGILSLSTALQSDNIFGTTSVVIEVSDTGRGIEPDHLKDIFEPFVSFKKERGTGLGLWICQAIIHTYGGKIEVKSSLGKGSSFAVIIPLSI